MIETIYLKRDHTSHQGERSSRSHCGDDNSERERSFSLDLAKVMAKGYKPDQPSRLDSVIATMNGKKLINAWLQFNSAHHS